jgi:hypothetical protein
MPGFSDAPRPSGVIVGEFHTCLGIDIQAASPAPDGELLSVDVGVDDSFAAPLKLLYETVGLLAPLVIGDRQDVLIRHDRSAGRIVLRAVPGDADDLSLQHGVDHSAGVAIRQGVGRP